MNATLRLKTWAGPLTIGSFAVVAVTGVLMFFHLDYGLVKLAHEWMSWLLVVGAIAHVALNWRPFLRYFAQPTGLAIMAGLLTLGVLAFLPAGQHQHRGRPPFMEMSGVLEQSSLDLVAQVAKKNTESIQEQLAAQGIRVRHAQQTIAEIASENRIGSTELLGQILNRSAATLSKRS